MKSNFKLTDLIIQSYDTVVEVQSFEWEFPIPDTTNKLSVSKYGECYYVSLKNKSGAKVNEILISEILYSHELEEIYTCISRGGLLKKNNLRHTVQVVILSKEVGPKEIVCVSRKTDHSDFGLPGGKVDLTDESIKGAAIREVFEETGLRVKEQDLKLIFSMSKDGNMGHTYLCETFSGVLETDEPHVIKWGTFSEVNRGSFGEWNKLVMSSILDLNYSIKI